MTVVEEQASRVIGTPMLRREDPALLTGEAKYTNPVSKIAMSRSPRPTLRSNTVSSPGNSEVRIAGSASESGLTRVSNCRRSSPDGMPN